MQKLMQKPGTALSAIYLFPASLDLLHEEVLFMQKVMQKVGRFMQKGRQAGVRTGTAKDWRAVGLHNVPYRNLGG